MALIDHYAPFRQIICNLTISQFRCFIQLYTREQTLDIRMECEHLWNCRSGDSSATKIETKQEVGRWFVFDHIQCAMLEVMGKSQWINKCDLFKNCEQIWSEQRIDIFGGTFWDLHLHTLLNNGLFLSAPFVNCMKNRHNSISCVLSAFNFILIQWLVQLIENNAIKFFESGHQKKWINWTWCGLYFHSFVYHNRDANDV